MRIKHSRKRRGKKRKLKKWRLIDRGGDRYILYIYIYMYRERESLCHKEREREIERLRGRERE